MFAHSVSLNSFGQVSDVFSALLGEKLMPLISKAFDTRTSVGSLMTAPRAFEPKVSGPPIIKDADVMSADLSRLFEIRHILCHEFPRKEVYDREEITTFLNAAGEFSLATNEVLIRILRGNAPTTIHGMKEEAERALRASEIQLADIVSRLDDGLDPKRWRLLERANKRWMAFRAAHGDYRAARAGSEVSAWLRFLAEDKVTRARIDDLLDELPDGEEV